MNKVMVVLAFGCLLTTACKDAGTELCLEGIAKFDKAVAAEDNAAQEMAGEVYQMCGISCDITKDEDGCAAFKRVTEVICDREGKETCQTLCEGSNDKKNEYACAKASGM